MFRCCYGLALVTQARMMRPVLCNVRTACQTTLLRFAPHYAAQIPLRQSSPTSYYFAQKATLPSRSELNFAVAIYSNSKTVRMRGVVTVLAWFRARQHSNNGFGGLNTSHITLSRDLKQRLSLLQLRASPVVGSVQFLRMSIPYVQLHQTSLSGKHFHLEA